jgi:hypothetical protein
MGRHGPVDIDELTLLAERVEEVAEILKGHDISLDAPAARAPDGTCHQARPAFSSQPVGRLPAARTRPGIQRPKSDGVATVIFCAPRRARTTVINGKVVVRDGEIVTTEMGAVIETHNRCAARLANES